MKFKHRMKRTTKQYIVVALICIITIGGAAVLTAFVITKQVREEYETLLSAAYNEIHMNQKNVYVAAVDIATGDIVSKDNVKKSTVYASLPQDSYITNEELGKQALIDIPTETNIMTTMVTDNTISSELREVEYQVININSNIITHDTVDVRIFFPNGEDYVVLPKKVLRGYDGETANCCLWLSEEEIIRIRNAIVDAYLYTGAFLYTTKYIEPNIQEASIVTYTPSVGAIELIQKNPNILETATNDLSSLVRKALENRLAKALNKDVSSQQWELFDDNIYQQYNGKILDRNEQVPEDVTQIHQDSLNEISFINQEVNKEKEENIDEPEKKNEVVDPNKTDASEEENSGDIDTTNMTNLPDLGSAQPSDDMVQVDQYFMLREDE
ncbi:MAG: hypothetical protein H6Q59_2314 [Firmicutes bacterium]|nr:hypothetical protein [Bacillota bacterium]